MTMLSVMEAQEQYPEAWCRIEADIEQMRQGTAGTIDPVVAAVLEFDGKDMLEVIAFTDFIEKGHEGYPASVTFRANLNAS